MLYFFTLYFFNPLANLTYVNSRLHPKGACKCSSTLSEIEALRTRMHVGPASGRPVTWIR